ncbi:BnaA09g05080D [Brassica napus]|uniref:BnaA09g05080D protein n=1 Tax=Brassica napus TaxID=3708 RepID=A0A078FV09_BRANA|nr:BnaA09g05080D [Brassica napus]
MSSRGREVEVTISSAKNIKNVNWRNGPNKPYAVVWIDPKYKFSTRVDEEDDTCPSWNQTFVIPLPPGNDDYDDDKVYIDVVHAGGEENTKPLIGSAHLSLRDVIDDVGFGVPVEKTLKLKRPSGRPHGKLDVTVTVREPRYQPAPGSYHAPPYGYTHAPPQPKGSKFGGMGTGLAVGAVAGVLGGVALAEGLDEVEDDIAEEAAEDVEDDDAGEDDEDF